MILYTTKKATAIYKLISSFLFIFFLSSSFATEDLTEFCFERSVNLNEAQQAMSFLLLSHEKVFLRRADNCLDVLVSPDRSKLLEKFLRKRYNLIAETGIPSHSVNLQDMQCRLEFTTTRIKKIEVKDFKAGAGLKVATGTRDVKESTVSELLVAFEKAGSLEIDGRTLQMECVKKASGVYQLTFYFSEENKSRINTSVSLKQGEVLQLGNISRDLASQSKSLGYPQIKYEDIKGQENISYELKIL